MFGFLIVNKPSGLTSRRVVDRVKNMVRPWKVGHCGTLDPLASGVLIVCIGPATRLARFVLEMKKSYIADFRLGVCSPTDDLEGELSSMASAPLIQFGQLHDVIPDFVGSIQQKPPAYSAIKLNGKRAYRLARAGQRVELQDRSVEIDDIAVTRFDYPDFQLNIACGSGTYIRSIGRDLGHRLNSAAVMTGLQRTGVGPFRIAEAVEFDEIDPATIRKHLVPPINIFKANQVVQLDSRQLQELVHGGLFSADTWPCSSVQNRLVAVDEQGRLLAILTPFSSGTFKPQLNFAHYYLDHSESGTVHQSRDSS